ncbi:amidohydrolase family protein [Piscirickettsia litoralis]|uniref:Amidohydrolase-related domain-containing protein n=1 Tax=Piscirickettsia litoralis TaxID=1891921 RepID=A0ABX3A6H7_9GAMM|nr:amidohydrolase family protein [Piscirickettsia litoralis]ODN43296.1 hypothetical protein BGC07_10645 [Piscirickettsia litoralis]
MLFEKRIIDTHFHIWDTDKFTLPWLSFFKDVLKTKYSLEDYAQAKKGYNILKSCYVEVDAIPEQREQEAKMAISLCDNPQNQVVAATIGCDLSAANFESYILKHMKEKHVKSVRHNFFTSDLTLTRTHQFIKNTQLLGQLGIMCDLIMDSNKMAYGINLAEKCPGTTFIIDHCGVCPINADVKAWELWQQGIKKYSQLNNTVCKISECGFTEPSYSWKVEDVIEIIRHCVNSFGEDRVIYGSNWPVCEITSSLGQWITAIDVSLKGCSQESLDKLFFKKCKKIL